MKLTDAEITELEKMADTNPGDWLFPPIRRATVRALLAEVRSHRAGAGENSATATDPVRAVREAWAAVREVLAVEIPVDHFPGGQNGEGACPEPEGGECDCGAQARNLAAGEAEARMNRAVRALSSRVIQNPK